jgi:GntR family transcriptional regulator
MDGLPESRQVETARAQPLYAQVKALMLQRLIAGKWRPGDALAADNVVVRRQGRGTFVAEHDDHRALFHFFHLVGPDSERRLPESRLISVRKGLARRIEAGCLGIGSGAPVIRIRRVRSLDGQPAIAETITVPQVLFPDLADIREVPNTLYDLYERRYGITIARAVERLSAVAAAERDARLLGIAPGAPLLEIDRIALALDGNPVEWRVSRCHTATHHYQVELG